MNGAVSIDLIKCGAQARKRVISEAFSSLLTHKSHISPSTLWCFSNASSPEPPAVVILIESSALKCDFLSFSSNRVALSIYRLPWSCFLAIISMSLVEVGGNFCDFRRDEVALRDKKCRIKINWTYFLCLDVCDGLLVIQFNVFLWCCCSIVCLAHVLLFLCADYFMNCKIAKLFLQQPHP